jgi:hypothetical protein
MKLHKYGEFLTESGLQLLLEANMDFSEELISVLKRIDSPISKNLIDIEGKELDINQNFIDINKDKTDVLFFKPDDKVGKIAKVGGGQTFNNFFSYLAEKFSKNVKSGVEQIEGEYQTPEDGQIGQVIKYYTISEIAEFISGILLDSVSSLYQSGGSLALFQWVKSGKKYQNIASSACLITGPEVVKSSEVGVGKLARALLNKSGVKFTDAEIEDFVYKYRAEIEKLKNVLTERFRVVKGDDIKKYYHGSKYESEGGDLGNSCMRYDRCQSYFSIYTDNSQASLLILLSETEEDKIAGRAILWEMEPYEVSTKVMDRIYTIRTADQQLFKDWARENGYWSKEKQDFSEYTDFVFRNKETGEIIEKRQGEFSVKLDNGGEYSSYPYMDSFKYYNPRNGTLYNSSNFDYEYELTDTDGGNGSCGDCGGSGVEECSNCDGDGEIGCYECDGDGEIRCGECRGSGEVECSYCEEYGEVDCTNCDGSGEEECETCGGDGEDDDGEECGDCQGSGRQSCHDCSGGGKKECSSCDGDGVNRCDECSGDGTIECSDCDGGGQVECSDCDGSGRTSCHCQ